MPNTPPSSRFDAVEDLRRALNALGEVDLALTLRAEQLTDEPSRGVLECILRDHLGKAIAELRQLALDLAAARPSRCHPRRHRRPSRP